MDKYIIGEKEYTRQELLDFGKQHYPKFYWIPRGIGIGLMFIGTFLALIYMLVAIAYGAEFEGESYNTLYYLAIIPCLIVAVAGFIAFAASFVKKPDDAYIQHAIAYYEKVDANNKIKQAKLNALNEKTIKQEDNKDVSQLIKYKELLDKGIITQEEFDQKKKELL